MESTMENAYRFEFLPPGPDFKPEALVAAKPTKFDGTPVRIILGESFMNAHGIHNKCFKYTLDHVAKMQLSIPAYNLCDCAKEAEKRKLNASENASMKRLNATRKYTSRTSVAPEEAYGKYEQIVNIQRNGTSNISPAFHQAINNAIEQANNEINLQYHHAHRYDRSGER